MRVRLRSLVALANAAALLSACRGPTRGPAPAPPPTDDRPVPEAPAPAPVESARPLGPSVAVSYSSGTQRYLAVTTAVVQVAADGMPPESDSLTTRAYVTYVLGGGGVGQSVGGAVDSVFVTSRRSPAASQAVTTALPFSGTVTGTGVRLTTPPGAAAATCTAASTDAVLGVARDLLVALPPSLTQGAAWRDSSVVTACRGNVPTTSSTVHEYRVTQVVDTGPARTATVERTSRAAVSGQGSGGSAGTTITGTATAQARFTFDLATGRYAGGEITSASDLTVTDAGRTQRLTQRGVTRVSTVSPAP
jgi:hypothetical protein